jgi:hypothetical protein
MSAEIRKFPGTTKLDLPAGAMLQHIAEHDGLESVFVIGRVGDEVRIYGSDGDIAKTMLLLKLGELALSRQLAARFREG